MKEQADIAQKAGCHRHDDTLPLVVAVRGQRSDICWTSMVLLLESVCPKTCWNRVRQTGTCRGKAPPSCYARPFCRLKAPLGLSLLRCAAQTRTFENTSLSAVCKKKRGKLWQRERGLDGASPLDKEKHKALYYNKAIRT